MLVLTSIGIGVASSVKSEGRTERQWNGAGNYDDDPISNHINNDILKMA